MSLSRSDAEVRSHQSRGWLRRASNQRPWVVPTVIIAVCVLGAGIALAAVLGGRGDANGATPPAGCSGTPITITVVTSGSAFQVLDKLAGTWTDTKPALHGKCVVATVAQRDSGQVAAALGPNWDATRDGARPDVWIPDSSLWLSVAGGRPDAAALLPTKPPSIASSPLVLAVRQPLAAALGFPQRNVGWQDVFGAFAAADGWARLGHPEWSQLKVGLADPGTSTAGLGAVLALLDPAGKGSVSDQQLIDTLKISQAFGGIVKDTADFFTAQSQQGGQAQNANIAAFPALESDVATYDTANPNAPMVPVYLPDAPVVADFPYTVLKANWVGADQQAAAARFLDYLRTDAAADALAVNGLRAADRSVRNPAVLRSDEGFQASLGTPRPNLSPAAISQIIAQWASLQRQNNIYAVLDTSGSMGQPVPGTNLTRLQLLQQTASAGFGLLPSTCSIALWDFSQAQPGVGSEYRELVPFGPVTGPLGGGTRAQALQAKVAGLQANGFTPLYDTIYAAFHAMQAHWQPNSTNAVLLITDGSNELPGGLSLGDLIGKLTKEEKADQPVQVISIAVGPEADAGALQQISNATGGRTFVAKDPAAAVQTLVLAFSGRLG